MYPKINDDEGIIYALSYTKSLDLMLDLNSSNNSELGTKTTQFCQWENEKIFPFNFNNKYKSQIKIEVEVSYKSARFALSCLSAFAKTFKPNPSRCSWSSGPKSNDFLSWTRTYVKDNKEWNPWRHSFKHHWIDISAMYHIHIYPSRHSFNHLARNRLRKSQVITNEWYKTSRWNLNGNSNSYNTHTHTQMQKNIKNWLCITISIHHIWLPGLP